MADNIKSDAKSREMWRQYFREEPAAFDDMPVMRYLALLAAAGAVVLCILALLGPIVGNVYLIAR